MGYNYFGNSSQRSWERRHITTILGVYFVEAGKGNLGIREGISDGFSFFCSGVNHWIGQVWVFCGGSDKKKVVLAKEY